MVIGVSVIIVGASIATSIAVTSCGQSIILTKVIMSGVKAALLSGVVSATKNALFSGVNGIVNGKGKSTIFASCINSAIDGFTWGSIMSAASQISCSIVKKITEFLGVNGRWEKLSFGNLRLFSTNSPNGVPGLTIIRYGTNKDNIRLDIVLFNLIHINIERLHGVHLLVGAIFTGLFGKHFGGIFHD